MNIRELYESIDLNFIKQCVEEETVETEILDFKEASTQSGPMQRDDKRNLSKALSGFANGSGGILIWGVKATQIDQGADAAQELKPISNLRRFLTDLNTLSPQLVSPYITDVTHKMIVETGQSDQGYVVSFFPEGGNEPHMATSADLQRYYCRSGSSFMQMPHTMVADRFHRLAKPELSLCLTYLSASESQPNNRIFIGIVNKGVATAHCPAVSFGPRYSFPVGDCLLMPASLTVAPMVSVEMQNGQLFQAGKDVLIHPKTMLAFLRWEHKVPIDRDARIFADFEVFASGYYRKGFFYTTLGDVIDAQPGFTLGTIVAQDAITFSEH